MQTTTEDFKFSAFTAMAQGIETSQAIRLARSLLLVKNVPSVEIDQAEAALKATMDGWLLNGLVLNAA